MLNLFLLFSFFLSVYRLSENKENLKQQTERKFLVFESKLLSLFATCPLCSSELCDASVKDISGSAVSIEQTCNSCTYARTWSSQPHINQMPAGNLLLSSCILLSGMLTINIRMKQKEEK